VEDINCNFATEMASNDDCPETAGEGNVVLFPPEKPEVRNPFARPPPRESIIEYVAITVFFMVESRHSYLYIKRLS
jgi:hypothetical protein